MVASCSFIESSPSGLKRSMLRPLHAISHDLYSLHHTEITSVNITIVSLCVFGASRHGVVPKELFSRLCRLTLLLLLRCRATQGSLAIVLSVQSINTRLSAWAHKRQSGQDLEAHRSHCLRWLLRSLSTCSKLTISSIRGRSFSSMNPLGLVCRESGFSGASFGIAAAQVISGSMESLARKIGCSIAVASY